MDSFFFFYQKSTRNYPNIKRKLIFLTSVTCVCYLSINKCLFVQQFGFLESNNQSVCITVFRTREKLDKFAVIPLFCIND